MMDVEAMITMLVLDGWIPRSHGLHRNLEFRYVAVDLSVRASKVSNTFSSLLQSWDLHRDRPDDLRLLWENIFEGKHRES